MSKHTPGPWRRINSGHGFTVIVPASDPSADPIATVPRGGIVFGRHPEGEANGALIGAAPLLLAAVEAFLADHQRRRRGAVPCNCPVCVTGRAAVTLATNPPEPEPYTRARAKPPAPPAPPGVA